MTVSAAGGLRGENLYEHLGIWSRRIDEDSAETFLPITSDIGVPGGVRAAALGMAFEQGGARYVYDKAMVVPAQIALHIRDSAAGVRDVRSVTRLVRAGRSLVVTEGELHDLADEKHLIGYGSIIWAVIGDAPGEGAPLSPPEHRPTGMDVVDAVGIEPLADGLGVRLAGLTPQILGPGGILHAGVHQFLCEEAVRVVAREVTGSDRVVAVDCTYDFLQPGKVGPFVATAERLHVSDTSVDARVAVRDEGNQSRMCCVSWVKAVVM